MSLCDNGFTSDGNIALWRNGLIEEVQRRGLGRLRRLPRPSRTGGPVTRPVRWAEVLAAVVVAVIQIPKLLWPNGFAAPRAAGTTRGDKGCEALT